VRNDLHRSILAGNPRFRQSWKCSRVASTFAEVKMIPPRDFFLVRSRVPLWQQHALILHPTMKSPLRWRRRRAERLIADTGQALGGVETSMEGDNTSLLGQNRKSQFGKRQVWMRSPSGPTR
jgi:hypothetical protein